MESEDNNLQNPKNHVSENDFSFSGINKNKIQSKDYDTIVVNSNKFDHLFLVMQLGERDMKDLMETVPKTRLSEDHIITILYNILCAINFMHQSNVIHRDLKPSNILIDSNCNIQLCDFGLSRIMPQ